MDIEIINAREQDIFEASKVFVEAFTSVGEEWTFDIAKKRLEEYFNPEMFWIAKLDSRIIGMLSSKTDYMRDGKDLYIDIIAVLPEYQKSGAGNLLINKAFEYAKKNKLNGIWLLASSKLNSYEWYKKLGMKQSSWGVLYLGI